MPLYTVTTQIGVLSVEAKAKLAAEVTTLHSEYSGVPKNWVHIGLSIRERLYGRAIFGNCGAHTSDSIRPISGIQEWLGDAPLGIAPIRNGCGR